jgi:hypothetical protein
MQDGDERGWNVISGDNLDRAVDGHGHARSDWTDRVEDDRIGVAIDLRILPVADRRVYGLD